MSDEPEYRRERLLTRRQAIGWARAPSGWPRWGLRHPSDEELASQLGPSLHVRHALPPGLDRLDRATALYLAGRAQDPSG